MYCNILIKWGWCLLGGFRAGNIDDADMPMKRLKVSKVAYLYDEGSGGDGLGWKVRVRRVRNVESRKVELSMVF